MKAILAALPTPVRLLLLLAPLLGAGLALPGCATADVSEDTTIYPTPAEKNQQMQERMSQVTRSLL